MSNAVTVMARLPLSPADLAMLDRMRAEHGRSRDEMILALVEARLGLERIVEARREVRNG